MDNKRTKPSKSSKVVRDGRHRQDGSRDNQKQHHLCAKRQNQHTPFSISIYRQGTGFPRRHACRAGGSGRLTDSGRSVKLKGAGSLRLTCQTRGKATDTPEELTTDTLTDVKMRFIPEYSRGQRGQITGRTMMGKYLEWIEVAEKQ